MIEKKDGVCCSTPVNLAVEGAVYKKARLALRMTRAAMAREIGVAWGTIDRFENGVKVHRRKFLKQSYYNALMLRVTQMMLELTHTDPEGDLS